MTGDRGSPFDDDAGSGSGSVYVFVRSGTSWRQHLSDLLLCFGQPAVPGCEAQDINEGGTVNVLDLIDLLLVIGQACR